MHFLCVLNLSTLPTPGHQAQWISTSFPTEATAALDMSWPLSSICLQKRASFGHSSNPSSVPQTLTLVQPEQAPQGQSSPC